MIGHRKAEHRMDRNHLKGTPAATDRTPALAAAGYGRNLSCAGSGSAADFAVPLLPAMHRCWLIATIA